MSVPFVGRRQELAALAALVERARRGRAPAAALVSGEPGSGKTRLLAEALQGARLPGVVRAAGFEPMQPIPLAAMGPLLRLLAKQPGDGALLDRLVFGGPDAQSGAPLRIFEAAHRALSSTGPLVVVVDDLQWVDEQSLALVHYLLRAAEQAHQAIVVLAAFRPSSAAAAFRSSLEPELPADRQAFFDLGPLPLEAGRSLARSIVHDLDDAGATDLWRRAGGSPFWLEALARGRGSDVPSGLIDERLRDLGGDAGALLAALAVGARPFSEDELAGLLDWAIDRVQHASRELVAGGLGLEAGGTIRVAHDLIREATAGAIPAATRRRLHVRLATWIEASGGDDLSLLREALHHRAAAELPTADLAARLLSSGQQRLLGADDLRLIASISDGLGPGAPGGLDLDRRLAPLAAVIGEQELALERWERVSENTADVIERQHAETEAARAAYILRRSSDAHRHLDRAREALPGASEAAVRVDALQADVELWLEHETAAGSRTAARALAAAGTLATEAGGIEQLSPEGRRAYLGALVTAGDAALQEDRAADVLALSEVVVQVAEGLDDESRIAALIRVGFALGPVGRIREAEAQYRRAWEVSRRLVLPTLMVDAGRGLARVLRLMGRLAEAYAVAVETGQVEARIRNIPRRWGTSPPVVHAIELSLGDPASALRALRHDVETEPDPHFRLGIHEVVAEWHARYSGARLATAVEAELAAAHAASALAHCPRCAAELSIITAELLARIGRVEAARDELAAWDAQKTDGYLQRDMWRMRATAAIAAADGDDRTAVGILEGYAAELERAGLLEDLLWVRIDLGRALTRIDRARAVDALTSAANLAERVGAISHGRLAARELRRLGVRAWRRGRYTRGDGLDGLSVREREIAGLVADGGTNREIADALLLSPKTVERHVTNVLAKLGLRNRTEVASLIRSGLVRGSPDE